MDQTSKKSNSSVPMPLVNLNRAFLVVGILAGLLIQIPLLTTALFLMVVLGILFGSKASLAFMIGKRVFARQIPEAKREDIRLVRFNNILAASLLGAAQLAFLSGITWLGWMFALFVALAAGVALAGFCVGCFLYFQFNLQKSRFFGS